HVSMSLDAEWIDSSEACSILGVKRATLYAYVSRHRIRTTESSDGRRRRYHRSDITRIKKRGDARRGHGAVAAGALRWGEPVLDTAIGGIEPTGHHYRGIPVLELLAKQETFESILERLWSPDTGDVLPGMVAAPPWIHAPPPDLETPVDAMRYALLHAEKEERRRYPSPAALRETHHRLVRYLVAAVGWYQITSSQNNNEAAGRRAERSLAAFSVARGLLLALDRKPHRIEANAVDTALVTMADHGLNASTFAARVAASAGASSAASLSAALATFSGSQHGAAVHRIASLLHDVDERGAAQVVGDRVRRGEDLPGFGHPAYPAGDPRFTWLWKAAEAASDGSAILKIMRDLVAAMRLVGGPPPNADLGLLAVAGLLENDPRRAAEVAQILFAVGRSAGWLAHVAEQRAAGFLLRPRAQYRPR
ncbi:MAG: citrate synthase, partial [Myxococcota bacterium]